MSFRVAVVGAGRMGRLHARVFSEMTGTELVCVVDTDPAAGEAVAREHGCQAVADAADAVGRVDAAVIAVPTVHHVPAAWPFVQAGKAVLIEKPFTDDLDAGRNLIALSRQTGAVVQVGHTERFNPVLEAVRKFDIRPKFIEAQRISPFTFRSADVGVVLDLMIHDIDLVLLLAGGQVEDLHAVGINVLGRHEDICSAWLIIDNGCVANITASRLAVKTERKMRIFSEQAYLSVDYAKKVGFAIQKTENLDLIQMARDMDVKDLAEAAAKIDYARLIRAEQLVIDDSVEPLRRQAEAFRRAVREGVSPAMSAEEGLAAVQVAHRVLESVKSHRWDGPGSRRVGLDILGRNP